MTDKIQDLQLTSIGHSLFDFVEKHPDWNSDDDMTDGEWVDKYKDAKGI